MTDNSNLKKEFSKEAENSTSTPNPLEDKDKECQDILEKENYYEILGVSINADQDKFKKAYREVKLNPNK